MKDRIKQIRKSLNLTQEAFGGKLGVRKTAISKLEKGENNLTEQMVKLICSEFNVNETWLRTGDGEPFSKLDDDKKIASVLEKVLSNDDDFIKRTMLALAELDKSQLDAIKTLVSKIASTNFHSVSNIPVVNTENKEVLKHEVAIVEAEQQPPNSETSTDLKHVQ